MDFNTDKVSQLNPLPGRLFNDRSRFKIFLFVISLCYAIVLTSLPLHAFADRANYLDYASSSGIILLGYLKNGIMSMVFNEPLWLGINMFLHLFFQPENVVRLIIFVSSFTFAYFFLKADPKNILWLILFLLLPQIIENYITHLRQGVAISVFLPGFFSKSNVKRWLLMGITPLIHASFFLILPLFVVPYIFKRMNFANNVRLSIITIAFLILSLSLGAIVGFLGARQASRYSFQMSESASGLGFIFWMGMLLLTFCESKRYIRTYSVAIFILLIYLSTYFFTEVTARVFESGLPIVLLSLLQLKKNRKYVFWGSISVYWVLNWIVMLKSGSGF